jgi:hypothetical protein
MDFLKRREGEMVFFLYNIEIIRGCVSLKKRCKGLREFEEIEISRQSCRV